MKKLAYLINVLIGLSAISITGCKEDTTPPNITLNGDAHVLTPKGAVYADLSATATDNKDESVYVINNVSYISPKHPETDIAGDYTVTYTAQDRSGNTSTITRRVSVTYSMWELADTYDVYDTCISNSAQTTQYISTVNTGPNQVYRTYFSNFRGLLTADTYFDPVTNTLAIPSQRPEGAGSPYLVAGTGTIWKDESTGIITWDIYYTCTNDTMNPDSVETRHAIFISQ